MSPSGEAKILFQWGQSLIGICSELITFGYNFFLRFSVGATIVKNFKTLVLKKISKIPVGATTPTEHMLHPPLEMTIWFLRSFV